MKKFTMELVWHNCLEYPPREDYNECLFITNGNNVWEVEYDNGDWISAVDAIPIKITNRHYWADIEQTVQGDERFRNQNETY